MPSRAAWRGSSRGRPAASGRSWSRCLADAPAGRYADAGALVEDLQRYRAGVAVHAHPESVFERAGRFASRYRTFILLVAAYLIMRAVFAWLQRR